MTIPRISGYAMPLASEFPTNKTSWTVEADKAVLLVHDMQQYFLNFYDLSQQPIPALLQHCQDLIAACHAANIPVVYTAQPGNQTPEHRQLLTDFWGKGLTDDPDIVRIIPQLAPLPQDIVLTKWRYSAFQRTNLLQFMQDSKRNQLIVCGVYAHIGCLLSSADAFMFDIKPFLVGDALADFSREEHEMALKYAAGRCAQVASTSSVLTTLKPALPTKTLAVFDVESLRLAVAQQLHIDAGEIQDDDNLMLLGLDSVRLMALVAGWKEAGSDIEFQDVAEQPTLEAWAEKLRSAVSPA